MPGIWFSTILIGRIVLLLSVLFLPQFRHNWTQFLFLSHQINTERIFPKLPQICYSQRKIFLSPLHPKFTWNMVVSLFICSLCLGKCRNLLASFLVCYSMRGFFQFWIICQGIYIYNIKLHITFLSLYGKTKKNCKSVKNYQFIGLIGPKVRKVVRHWNPVKILFCA